MTVMICFTIAKVAHKTVRHKKTAHILALHILLQKYCIVLIYNVLYNYVTLKFVT